MKLKEAAKKVEDGIEETLTFPRSTGQESVPIMSLNDSIGRYAAEPEWWWLFEMAILPSCWFVLGYAMWLAHSINARIKVSHLEKSLTMEKRNYWGRIRVVITVADYKDIRRLYLVEGMSQRQIAQMMGISRNTANRMSSQRSISIREKFSFLMLKKHLLLFNM